MKKFLLILAAAAMTSAASAQVMTSYSYSKSESKTMWYARVGMSFNNWAGAGKLADADNSYYEDGDPYSYGSRLGMDVDFGFQRPISNFGLYWGMELGIGTRGFSYSYDASKDDPEDDSKTDGHMLAWNVKYSPFTFGYKYSLTDDLKLDAHIGIFASYDFAGKKISYEDNDGEKWDWDTDELKDDIDYLEFDAGMQLGIGIWWKRFNLDFTWQRGFVPYAKDEISTYDYNTDRYLSPEDVNLYSSNFMIRLGVAF